MLVAAVATQIISVSLYASNYRLSPGRSALDLSRGDIRVLVSTPDGWEGPATPAYDFEVGFGLKSKKRFVSIGVTTAHLARPKSLNASPKESYIVGVRIKQDGEVTEIRRAGSFDAGANGKLTIWRIRSEADDYYLVLIVREQTEIDIYLRGHDADELSLTWEFKGSRTLD